MVVLEHVLICLQIKVCVVLRVLPEADRAVLIYYASYFYDVSGCQLAVILEANDLYFLPCRNANC